MKIWSFKSLLLFSVFWIIQFVFPLSSYSQKSDPFGNYGMILRRDSGKLHPSTAFVAHKPNIVICAAHTINKPGEFLFQPINSVKRYRLKLVFSDTLNDIAVLVSDSAISSNPLRISNSAASVGDSIYFCGFNLFKSRFISGKSVIEKVNIDGLKRFTYISPSIQGFSGGAIMNSAYEVIGVQIQINVYPWQDPLKDDPKITIASEIQNIIEKLISMYQ